MPSLQKRAIEPALRLSHLLKLTVIYPGTGQPLITGMLMRSPAFYAWIPAPFCIFWPE